MSTPNVPPYRPKIVAHYRPEMAPPEAGSYSKSPTKPRRFMEFLERSAVAPYVDTFGDFMPISHAQLELAHHTNYIQAVMGGIDVHGVSPSRSWSCESNGITWTPAFRDSVLLTTSSLLSATRMALAKPDVIQLSPTSGFHHARPHEGSGFCTFSGQVIAAVDTWRATGKACAWIDLDGHYGNSIEDTRGFQRDLNFAIPPGCNINPDGRHGAYVSSLARGLLALHPRFMSGEIHYLCVALGADNHEWDQLGGQVSTDEWISCVELVFSFVREWCDHLGRPVPLVLSLFGGYRDDHPESVLGLHAMGLARALDLLAGVHQLADWRAEVRSPR